MSAVAERRRVRAEGHKARRIARQKRTDEQHQAVDAERRQGERERWELRHRLRKVTSIKRQRACGLPGKREDGSVSLRVTEPSATAKDAKRRGRTAGFAGLFACGNVWTCPHCSRKIASVRAAELERVMGHYVERGGDVVLLTLTLRHNRGQRLRLLWDAIAKAWGNVTRGRSWVDEKKACDLAGWVRATEITIGHKNGWHPHVHVPLIFHTRPSPELLQIMLDGIWQRWESAVVGLGLDAPERDNHGMDVQRLDYGKAEGQRFESLGAISRYVSKGLALEATMGAQKEAKNGNRTTMQLLRDALTPYDLELPDGSTVETTDDTALELWGEYERVSKGRRQLEWCRDKDFKAVRLALNESAKLGDDEIAAEEMGTGDDDVAVIPAHSWHQISYRAWELKCEAEEGGAPAAWAWLTKSGIEWYRPTGLTSHFRQHPAVAADLDL